MTDKDNKKASFLMYFDFWEVIEELSIEQRGTLLTAIYAIQLGEDVPEMDKETRIVFKTIKGQIIRDKTKYEKTIEARSKAGKKGAESRWGANNGKTVENSTDSKQTIAKMADNVNVNVNVNDNVNDNVNVNVSDTTCDDTTQTFGILDNVRLTAAQFDQIRATYESPLKLIDKVSTWLPDAKHPPDDHFALVHRFALNDNWPKKQKAQPVQKPPDPERGPYCSAPDEVRKKARAVLGGLSVIEA